MSHFVGSSGPKHRKNGVVRKYLVCHRSGSHKMKPQPRRAHKRKGSVKCNKQCFATMSVSIKADRVTVKYQAEHYGHEKEACFQRLSVAHVQQVKAKLELGVPPKSLVAEAKAGAKNEGLNETHLLDAKGIRNIRTRFNIGFNEKRDADDFVSLRIWIDELQKNCEEPLVLYADKDALHIDGMDKFEMALMSPLQKDLLLEYGQDVICIDSTHGTTAHDLQLTTLMVRGSNGSVCKHIHAVALWQVNQKSPSQSESDDDGTMPSSSASNQPLLDPENNDDVAIPSSSTSSQLLQDPQSLLKRIESSETLEVPERNEMGSIQSKLAAVVQAFQAKDSIDSASAKLAHNYLDGL
ncbi:hypothetical protein HPB48_004482 [Haemaphysalis longicornis]|uniref:Uncharacterized protein n=1 Tax=Haemaphysalis longicornis TaxID=44386 RepID=A0A9J6GH23_HAELO|nr:hypothetical protein HPB48_004482 [Haemaphysalis longicornis]